MLDWSPQQTILSCFAGSAAARHLACLAREVAIRARLAGLARHFAREVVTCTFLTKLARLLAREVAERARLAGLPHRLTYLADNVVVRRHLAGFANRAKTGAA